MTTQPRERRVSQLPADGVPRDRVHLGMLGSPSVVCFQDAPRRPVPLVGPSPPAQDTLELAADPSSLLRGPVAPSPLPTDEESPPAFGLDELRAEASSLARFPILAPCASCGIARVAAGTSGSGWPRCAAA
jgi:hypothetical protein